MIALPVLEERAEVVYHSEHRRMNRVVAAPGSVKPFSRESETVRRGTPVDSDNLSDGQYFDTSFFKLDKLAGLIECSDWKGSEATLELASQSFPPFTLCFPVGTLL